MQSQLQPPYRIRVYAPNYEMNQSNDAILLEEK